MALRPNDRLNIELAIKRKAVTPEMVEDLLREIDESEKVRNRLAEQLAIALGVDADELDDD